MMLNIGWLKQWVNTRASTQELVDKLTMAGLEVDGVERAAPPLNKVVIGEVLEVAAHPKADRLKVCTTNIGRSRPVLIVCGAPNVKAGMKVAVAQIGARLPNGVQIAKTRIRDVVSSGMLCSSQELGLDEAGAGILELDPDAKVGLSIEEHLQLDDDVIDIDLTPNRGDCLSVNGVAQEVAALTSARFKNLKIKDVSPTHKTKVSVKLQAPKDCARFTATVIEGVDCLARTPDWMRERLRRCGLRPVSAPVDITNYVMLELGQPMHAFDADKISGGIVVRRATDKESLELLDGKKVTLNDSMLVVTDDNGAVALAGIMGGAHSAVGDETKRILLEAAHFSPAVIAGRARQLGMHTDASHRFERGVDPELPARAQARAIQLYMQICGGKPGPLVEVASKRYLPKPAKIELRHQRLERVIGHSYTPKQVERALTGLGLEVRTNRDNYKVTAPTRRFDLQQEHDLIEEVVRVCGYDDVPLSVPSTKFCGASDAENHRPATELRQSLFESGYFEAITYSFVDNDWQSEMFPASKAIMVANPIASNMSAMRVSLLPGLLDAVATNLNRQNKRVRLFEYGHVFLGTRRKPKEFQRVALVATGTRHSSQWWNSEEELDFFDIKGDVETLLAATGLTEKVTFESAQHPSMHPGQSAQVKLQNKIVGHVGLLHPALQAKRELSQNVYVAELDADLLQQRHIPRYAAISRFPSTRRDLAVLVARDAPVQGVLDTVQKTAGVNLKDLELFDVYRGKGIDSSLKSVAFGLTLQHSSRTLTDAEIDDLTQRVLAALQTSHNAQLRG